MNKKNTPQNSRRSNNFQKNKKPVNTVENKNQGKGIRCREYESCGHIQLECANTLKKKEKSLKTTQSDSESDDSEDDDYISNYVGFQVTIKKDTLASVTTNAVMKDVTRTDFEMQVVENKI